MSIAMQNQITEIFLRLEAIEETLKIFPKNGADTAFLESRLKDLENKYMAMNARMGKRQE